MNALTRSLAPTLRTSCCVLALLAGGAARATLAIDHTVSQQSSTFGVVSSNFETHSTISQTPPLGTYSEDFGALGAVELSFTWRAPAGQQIVVDTPAGWTNTSLSFIFRAGTRLEVGFRDLINQTLTFEGLTGDPDTATTRRVLLSGSAAPDNDSIIWGTVVIPLTPGETFSFESATLTANVDASFDTVFDEVPIDSVFVQGYGVHNGAPADPGQWVSLSVAAVPEANACLCFGLVTTLLAAKRARTHRAEEA